MTPPEATWVCDHCKKRERWGKTWRWHYGMQSEENTLNHEGCPAMTCSDECEDALMKERGA